MVCIADVAIAMKVAELAKRCGLKASHVDGAISFVDMDKDPKGEGYFVLSFGTTTYDPDEKTEKFFNLLGMKDTRTLKGPELEDLEDVVDSALSLAPRGRSI